MADYSYIDSAGVIIPDTSQTKAEVVAGFRSAFGADMPVDDSTPQGVLINLEVEARDAQIRHNAEIANQINPDYAGGVFLDGIWAWLGGARRPAVRSQLIGVIFSGAPGTLIPVGSVAEVSATQQRFTTTQPVIIGVGGSATVDMEAEDFGPIQVPVGGLDSVASSVLGWETVTNPNAAIPGSLAESDASARRRRRQTLAIQGLSIPEAITSELYSLDGVKSLAFRENTDSSTQVVDGVIMVEHSVWVCVDGGSSVEIAEALHRSKTIGAAWSNGAGAPQSVPIVDEFSGQSYNILFDRPLDVPFFIRVTVKPSSLDVSQLIPDIIMRFSEGELEGESGFTVGTDVSIFEISGAINQVEPSIFVKKVEVSLDGIAWGIGPVITNLWSVARIQRGSIIVTIQP